MLCRPPVLPDNRGIDRFSRLPVPHEGCLTLIGHADTGHTLGVRQLGERLAANFSGHCPDFLGIVFNPAVRRKILGEFLLRLCDHRAVRRKYHGATARRPLIDRQNQIFHVFSEVKAGSRSVSIFRGTDADWVGGYG